MVAWILKSQYDVVAGSILHTYSYQLLYRCRCLTPVPHHLPPHCVSCVGSGSGLLPGAGQWQCPGLVCCPGSGQRKQCSEGEEWGSSGGAMPVLTSIDGLGMIVDEPDSSVDGDRDRVCPLILACQAHRDCVLIGPHMLRSRVY